MMNQLPYEYQLYNKLNSAHIPSTIHIADNNNFQFHAKYLLQKAMSVIKIDNMPDTWDESYFMYCLFCNGYVGILDTEDFGVIPQFCTLKGINVFYRPKSIIVSNPILGTLEKTINVDCTLIKLMPDYSSILDIVGRYAAALALCDESADINTFNSQLSYIFGAEDKATAATFKQAFDLVHSGEPAVAVGKGLFDEQGKPKWTTFTQNLSSNFIANDVYSLKKKIMNEFDTMVGIPNTNTDKKENLIIDEVNSNNVETYCRAALWIETIKNGIEATNKMFGTDMSVDFRIDPEASVNNGTYFKEDINETVD